jgi:hypothetical protein
MSQTDTETARRRERLVQALPWFVNGTLPQDERIWVEQVIAADAWAKTLYARELELLGATRAHVERAPDVAVGALLDRISAGRLSADRVQPRSASGNRSMVGACAAFISSVVAALSQPKFAMAMVAVIAMQAVMLGYVATHEREGTELTRSVGRGNEPSIRLRVKADISEEAFRTALRGAGVTISAGPDHLDEYVARPGDVKSLEEAVSALRRSDAFEVVDVVR